MKLKYLFIAALFPLLFSCNDDDDMDPCEITPELCATDTMDVIEPDTLIPWINIPGDTTMGKVTAEFNNSVLWVGSIHAITQTSHPTDPDGFITLELNTYESEFRFLRESMVITEFPKNQIGNFETEQDHLNYDNGILSASYFTLVDDGDVLGDTYDLETTFNNNGISIDEIDLDQNIYKGRFNMRLCRVRSNGQNTTHSDTLTFKNAEFWFELQ